MDPQDPKSYDPFSHTAMFNSNSLKNSNISPICTKQTEILNTSDMNPYQNEKLSESILNERKNQPMRGPPPQQQFNTSGNFGNNNYDMMMNMFKMFPQMMDYMNNYSGMNYGMNIGFNPQMNPMFLMKNMGQMSQSMSQMNPLQLNNMNNNNNNSNMNSNFNSFSAMNPLNNNNNSMGNSAVQNQNSQMFNANIKNDSLKMEEILRNKARNLNEFYNAVNNPKKPEENVYTYPNPRQTTSKKLDNYLEESEVKLPNKSEFLNYQGYENENPNQNENDNYEENIYNNNYGANINNLNNNNKNSQNNRNLQPNLKENIQNAYEIYPAPANNPSKDTDEVKQKLFQNEKDVPLNVEEYNNNEEDYQNNNNSHDYDNYEPVFNANPEKNHNKNVYPAQKTQSEKEIPQEYDQLPSIRNNSERNISENPRKATQFQKKPSIIHSQMDEENYNNNSLNDMKNSQNYQNTNSNTNKNINSNHNITNNNNSKPFYSFDEIPISNKGNRKFEEMLEEELQSNQYKEYVPTASPKPKPVKSSTKKNYLKRHSRQFLSNAVSREHSKKKTKTPSNTDKISNEKFTSENIINKNAEMEEFIKEEEEIMEPSSQKKPKNFLTKGKGLGGGKGHISPLIPTNKQEKNEKTFKNEKIDKNDKIIDKSPLFYKRNEEELESGASNAKKYEPNKYVSSTPEESDQGSPGSKRKLEFNDDQEWGSNEKSPLKVNEKESKKEKDLDEDDEEEEEKLAFDKEREEPEGMEVQSNILKKYFNKNKKKDNNNKKPHNNIEISKEQEEEIIKKYVDDKIEALNQEIAKFKAENEAVKRMKKKYEDLNKTLNKQMEEFNKKKEQEKNEFEAFKQEEMKKLQREKKFLEKQFKKEAEGKISRKEREEIDTLKKQIAKITEENKLKDQRNKLAFERLRKQNEEYIQKNQELQEEIKHLELLRISNNKNSTNNNNLNSNAMKNNTYSNNNSNNVQKNVANDEKKAIKTAKKPIEIEEKEVEDEEEHNENEENDDFNEENEEKNEENTDEDEGQLENYEDIININTNKTKDPLQENKLTNKKTPVENIKPNNMRPVVNKNLDKKQASKENTNINNFKKPALASNINKKPELEKEIIDNQDEDEEEEDFSADKKYANITVRNLNKYFSEKDFDYENNKYYRWYIKQKNNIQKIKSSNVAPDGKIQRIYEDGKSELIFPNGVKREVFIDGYTIVHFTNNDVKQCLPNKVIIYYFAEAQTTQTTLPNGPNIYKFSNNQIEIHHLDGSKEIKFADGTEKYIYSNGEEETLYFDGTIQKIDENKTKTIFYANGQKDVILPDGTKIKEYPDGKVKRFGSNQPPKKKI